MDPHFRGVPCHQFFLQFLEHLGDLEAHPLPFLLVIQRVLEVLEDLQVPAFPYCQQDHCHLSLLVLLVDPVVQVHRWALVVLKILSLQEAHLALEVLFFHLVRQLQQFPLDPLLQAYQQLQGVH